MLTPPALVLPAAAANTPACAGADPMDVDPLQLDTIDLANEAAAEGGSGPGNSNPAQAGPAGIAKQAAGLLARQIQGSERDLLTKPIAGAPELDQLRQELEARTQELTREKNLSAVATNLLKDLAGAAVAKTGQDDLLTRAKQLRTHMGSLTKQVATKGNGYTNSPEKLDGIIAALSRSSSSYDTTKKDLLSFLDAAADDLTQASAEESTRETIYKVLQKHASGTKVSKAKPVDINLALKGKLLGTTQKHLQAVHAALKAGDSELAGELLVRYTSLQSEANKLLNLGSSIGMKEAQQLYLAQQDPYSGVTPDTWQLLSTLVSNKEYKKVFDKITLPDPRPPRQAGQKRKAGTAAADSNTTDSSGGSSNSDGSTPDSPPAKKHKKHNKQEGASSKDKARCSLCGKSGHLPADCWKMQANIAKAIAKVNNQGQSNKQQQQGTK